ncbi:MAG: STAS domain-containing protein [Planctomycetota bacterium]|jgi:anti-sigma B factor antagonist
MPFKQLITIENIEDVAVVNFAEKHISHMPQIEQISKELHHLIDNQNKTKIVIDFSEVQSLSSQTLGTLIKVQKKAEQAGCQIVLCGINRNISLMFKISRLEKIFTIYADKKKALDSFGLTSAG